jgi:Domain of unknown function (DUF4345)
MGWVASIAGTLSVLFGSYIQFDHGEVVPSVDSELRFYAVWYVFAGAALLRAVPEVEDAKITVRAVGVAFFAAGCGRLVSLVVVGRPHLSQLVLMVIELILPFVIIPWQASVARAR